MSDSYLDAQVGVLGSVLIDESLAGKVLYRTREEDYTGPYRSVYKAIRSIFQAGRPADVVTLAGTLGHEYDKLLLEITEITPTASRLDVYIEQLLEESLTRRLHELAEEVLAARTAEDAKSAAGRLSRALGDRPSVRVVSMAQGIQDFYERQKTLPVTLTWGMSRLDNAVMAEPGDFIVIGGHASSGKTALSVQLAWHQAEDRRIGYFSLETRPEKLIDRTVAMVTGIEFGRIKRHKLTQEDWTACGHSAHSMSERQLEIIQAGGLSVPEIQALALAGRYQVVYVDYLQLIRPADPRRPKYEQVTQISTDLHTMAQTTGITVVALSQLSRPEKSGDSEKSPTLHSLRESGQIEQDADAVLLLYREDPKDAASRRCLKVAKNKEGAAGGILMLAFDGSIQRFAPIDPTADVASAYSQAGRAVKQANRAKQLDFWADMPQADPNNPWPAAPQASGQTEKE